MTSQAQSELIAAKNSFNSFFTEVESLQDLQNVRLPEDATLQRYYLDALKKQAELLQSKLSGAIRFIDQAAANVEDLSSKNN